MAIAARRSSFTPAPGAFARQALPIGSVLLGSMTPLLPFVATAPVLPPFGFMMLVGWRLLRDDLWPVWIGLPLGLFDDLFSGQPLGSGMATWTMAMLAADAFARASVFRDHWQDWAIATGLIASNLLLALGIAWLTGGATPVWLLLPQLAVSALLFPMAVRICGALDRWRSGR